MWFNQKAMLQQLGKFVFLFGVVLVVVGGIMYLAGRLGLGRLPGDFSFGGKNWRIYLPIGTCIILSIILTLIMWIIMRLRK